MHISLGARVTGALSKMFYLWRGSSRDTPVACKKKKKKKSGRGGSSETFLHISLIVRRIKTNSDLRARIIIRIITGIIALPLWALPRPCIRLAVKCIWEKLWTQCLVGTITYYTFCSVLAYRTRKLVCIMLILRSREPKAFICTEFNFSSQLHTDWRFFQLILSFLVKLQAYRLRCCEALCVYS